jgi:DNA transformation protein
VSLDPDHIRELFAAFGPVQVRRMFGGAGLYADGVMFGLVSGGLIHLKADAGTVARFEAEGCRPFEYGTSAGRRAIMSYWRIPDRLYDDPDALAHWARQALEAARRAGKRRGAAGLARRKARTRR